ncbi:MAG TPA: hydrogenase expression/formation protein HypE [Solirubrobacteraceae bacterium]|nr:hydrogenase expression/formation protein HypE [Solirubrobacteraceae bacterium]
MAHGAGGKSSRSLIEGLLVPALASCEEGQDDVLARLADAGTLTLDEATLGAPTLSGLTLDGATLDGATLDGPMQAGPPPLTPTLALSTDSFVVSPLRFPGGSIGELAVNGTVNDLAVSGARALALTLSLVLEEGLDADVLRAEVQAIADAARRAGVRVIAGDTKVVEHGHADGMYVCTTGVGVLDPRARLSPAALAPGDRVLVSGPIGAHGMAIMLARESFALDAPIVSDTAPLWRAVDALLGAAGAEVHCMRDATRGGVASVLNELARASGVAALVNEEDVPVEPAVAAAAELLGIDPLYVANEGRLVACVAPAAAERALEALRSVPGCERAADIGEVQAEPAGMVLVATAFGGRRVMDLLAGDPLPRIC